MKYRAGLLLFVPAVVHADPLITDPQSFSAGVVGAAALVDVRNVDVAARPPATMGTSRTILGLGLAAAYGVTDRVTVGATYHFDLHDDSGSFPSNGRYKGPLLVHAAYSVVADGRLFVAAGLDGELHIENRDDRAVHAGVAAKYLVTPRLAVYTGNPLPLGPAGQQLAFQLADDGPVTLAVPVGLALQPAPQLFAYAGVTLAKLALAHASTQWLGRDIAPVDVGVLMRAVPAVDVGVVLTDDLEQARSYDIAITARYVAR